MADGGDDAAAVSGFSKELKIRFERLCWLSFLVGIKRQSRHSGGSPLRCSGFTERSGELHRSQYPSFQLSLDLPCGHQWELRFSQWLTKKDVALLAGVFLLGLGALEAALQVMGF